jgi:hypothetical protein
VSLLLHAIVPAEAVIVNAPLLVVAAGRLLGVATTEDMEMLAHHALVQQLHERFSACLPVRFPSRIADAAVLEQLLTKKQAELCAAMERVRGRCELAITGVWVGEADVSATTPGRRYLLQRQAQRQIAENLAEKIEQVLGAEAMEVHRKVGPRPGVALSMAVLVARGDSPAAKEKVRTVGERDGVRILVNGPWPAYSFASLDLREE